MRPEELRKFLKETPFRPIRLHLSNGRKVDIKHPDMAIVSRSLVAVGEGGRGGVADHLIHFNLLHIVEIEPIEENGRRKARKKSPRVS